MELLSEEMEGMTIISVYHHTKLEQFHSRKLILERRQGGAKLVSDIKLVPRKPRLIKRWLDRKKPRREAGEQPADNKEVVS
jgi:putative ATP-binding cassette transporter